MADGNLSKRADAVKRVRLRHEAVTLEPLLDLLPLEGEAFQLQPDRADLGGDGDGVLGRDIPGGHVRERELERFQLVHQLGAEGARRHDEQSGTRGAAGAN